MVPVVGVSQIHPDHIINVKIGSLFLFQALKECTHMQSTDTQTLVV